MRHYRAMLRSGCNAAAARARWVSRLCVTALVVALSQSIVAAADDDVRRCERCDGVIVEKLRVVGTDFADDQERLYCNVGCAMADMMEKFPTSRVVAHDPFAGKEVRVIRTGAKWVAWPKSAVFLFLPGAKELDPAQRCQAFPRQVEYVQYLATHPKVAVFKPRPLRLDDMLAELKRHTKQAPAAD
ncbi:MAG: hypothetical protein JSV65_15375 [Armatimonadota bacterium]|nr:MAG: hypothetical protein JSV65_15375 [Armatimonadota bacterium]